MDAGTLAIIEMVLVFGAVIGFGAWQLVSVSRAQRRGRDDGG